MAVGGGEAIISSNVRVAPAGTAIDVPLAHKDDIWSFDHFDTMTVMVPDAPRPDEIVVIMIAADGGRPAPRRGKGRGPEGGGWGVVEFARAGIGASGRTRHGQRSDAQQQGKEEAEGGAQQEAEGLHGRWR